MGGQFDGLSGAYRIPINIAPGTRGMQPQLAIRYTHGTSTGLLGVGFELEGLSAIEFAPRTPYYDGYRRELRYDGADALILDGKRLVEAGEGLWVLASDPYTEVRRTDEGYRVRHPNGMVADYGGDAATFRTAFGKVYRYALRRLADADGNYIDYDYEHADGAPRLRAILYTGNQRYGLPPYSTVLFGYEPLEQPPVRSIAGESVVMRHRITAISALCEGAEAYTYRLAYDAGDRLLRVEHTEQGIVHRPTAIRWCSQPNWTKISTQRLAGAKPALDLDSDGLPDLLSFDGEELLVGVSRRARVYGCAICRSPSLDDTVRALNSVRVAVDAEGHPQLMLFDITKTYWPALGEEKVLPPAQPEPPIWDDPEPPTPTPTPTPTPDPYPREPIEDDPEPSPTPEPDPEPSPSPILPAPRPTTIRCTEVYRIGGEKGIILEQIYPNGSSISYEHRGLSIIPWAEFKVKATSSTSDLGLHHGADLDGDGRPDAMALRGDTLLMGNHRLLLGGADTLRRPVGALRPVSYGGRMAVALTVELSYTDTIYETRSIAPEQVLPPAQPWPGDDPEPPTPIPPPDPDPYPREPIDDDPAPAPRIKRLMTRKRQRTEVYGLTAAGIARLRSYDAVYEHLVDANGDAYPEGYTVAQLRQLLGGRIPTRVLPVQMRGDGRTELLLVDAKGQLDVVGLNDAGRLSLLKSFDFKVYNPQYVHVGDFDGDGLSDMLILHDKKWKMLPMYNSNANSGSKVISSLPLNPNGLLVGDVDGDGRADIIYSEGKALNRMVLLRAATGWLQEDLLSEGIAGAPTALSDADADGVSDLIVANGSTVAALLMPQALFAARRVDVIDNGLQQTVRYSYGMHRQPNAAAPSGSALLPLRAPMLMLQGAVLRCAGSIEESWSYSRSGGLLATDGRGALGFVQTGASEHISGLSIVVERELLHGRLVERRRVERRNDKPVRTTTAAHIRLDGPTARAYALRPVQVDVKDHITGVNTSTSIEYHLPSGQAERSTTAVEGWRSISRTSWEAAGDGLWRTASTSTTTEHEGRSFVRSASYTYATDQPLRVLTYTAEGLTTRYSGHTPHGHPTRVEAGGRSHSYAYDAHGRFVVQHTAPDGLVSTYAHEAATGMPLRATDPNGLVAVQRREISDDGQSVGIIITPPQGLREAQRWLGWSNELGALSCELNIAPSGARTETHRDAAGRTLLLRTYGAGGTAQDLRYAYDAQGRLIRENRPDGTHTAYAYDALGRIVAETPSHGPAVRYDYSGLITTQTDGMGVTTAIADAMGNPLSVSGPTGTVHYAYGPHGQVERMDAGGAITAHAYDALGRLIATEAPGHGRRTYAYDALGQLVEETAPDGRSTRYAYDLAGRLIARLGPDFMETYTYGSRDGERGMLVRAERDGIAVDYAYTQEGGLPVVRTTAHIGGDAHTTAYRYGAGGQVVEEMHPGNISILRSYDSWGHQTAISHNGTTIWRGLEQDALGRWTRYQHGNGLTTEVAYGPHSPQPASIAVRNGLGEALFHQQYTHNPLGQLTQRTDRVFGLQERFLYDAADRLVAAVSLLTPMDFEPLRQTNYDEPVLPIRPDPIYEEEGLSRREDAAAIDDLDLSNCRICPQEHSQTTNYLSDGSISAWKRTLDQQVLEQYGYGYTAPQKLGWMSTSNQLRTGSPMAEMELHHSADAHLLAVHRPSGSAVRYALYAGGQRAMAEHIEHGQVALVRHHVGDAEVDIDPRTDRRTYRLRVQAPTGVAAVIESDGSAKGAAVSYVHTDFQGSWVLLTDAAGQAVAHQAFDAWGRPRNPYTWAPLPEGHGITMPGQRGYTGHEHLPSLGLIHMNGRVYAPGLQRFLSPDPVLQAPANAQSHNRYAYCLNTPLRYTDPSGYIHAPAVPRWPEGYDPPDHVDDPWGGSSGWARAMTPGMTYGWWAGLPAAAYGPAYYAYFGSDGSRNAPPSSHFDYVYGAGGERGRVEWKYRWESKPGKIQADGGIEVIGYKEWYVEWVAVGNDANMGMEGGGAGRGAQIATSALGTVNGMKRELFNYAARIDPSIDHLKYVKGVKAMGKVFNIANAGMTAWTMYNDYNAGHYYKLGARGIIWGVGMASTAIPVVGWAIAGSIGLADAIWGDDFYNWIETKFGNP